MKSLLIFASIFFVSIFSFATKFPCPREIKTKQSLVGGKKAWQSLSDPQSLQLLKSVEFYSGHPKKMAQLAPDNKDTKENPFWTFVPKDEIWQVCVYQNTSLRLFKKLGKALKRCDLIYSQVSSPQIDSVECN